MTRLWLWCPCDATASRGSNPTVCTWLLLVFNGLWHGQTAMSRDNRVPAQFQNWNFTTVFGIVSWRICGASTSIMEFLVGSSFPTPTLFHHHFALTCTECVFSFFSTISDDMNKFPVFPGQREAWIPWVRWPVSSYFCAQWLKEYCVTPQYLEENGTLSEILLLNCAPKACSTSSVQFVICAVCDILTETH